MLRSLLIGFFTLYLASPTIAGDWPGWRGPTGMGHTDERDLPLHWGGPEGRNIVWKAPLPGTTGKARLDFNQSSPIVFQEHAIVCMVYWPEGVAQSEYPEQHVACYHTGKGRLEWDNRVPPGPWKLSDLRGGYSAPTPCTDGKRIYALFGSSTLAALDFQGQIVWQQNIAPYGWDVAVGTSPVLAGQNVLVLADGTQREHSRLIALDCQTGEIRWEQKRPDASFSHSTPVLIKVEGQPQLLVSASNAVQGLDPSDGHVLWFAQHHGDVPTPVFANGLVYSEDGRGGPGLAVAPTGMGDVTNTLVKWKSAPVPEGYSSPIIVGDYVYRVHNPGILKCWKLETGELVYKERLPEGIDQSASPFATPDGRIYFASGGLTAVVAAGPEFELLATNDLQDPNASSAAVASGRIFIKGGRQLYCIGNP